MNYDFSGVFAAFIVIGVAIGVAITLAVLGGIELFSHISISWK